MKKTFTFILFQLLLPVMLIAQQAVTLTISGTPAKLTVFCNSSDDVKNITNSAPVKLNFVLQGVPFSQLTAISFINNLGQTSLSLTGTNMATIATGPTFNITVNSDQTINAIPGSHVSFPFTIALTYNGKTLSSGIIGSLSPNTPPGGNAVPAGSTPLTDGEVNTGVAYYDAMAISSLIKGKEYAALYNYIAKYYYPGTSIVSQSDLLATVKDNPFFTAAFQNVNKSDSAGVGSAHSATSKISISSIGNMDVTSLADGLAQFLVKRSEQELTIAFFDKFNKFINSNPDAGILFPATLAVFQNIGTQVYNYQAYLSSLRSAFEKDINGLPVTLQTEIKSGSYASYFNTHGDLKDAGLSALYIANALIQKEHPGQIIAGFQVDSLLADAKNKNIKAAVQTLQLFSQSLRSAGTDHYWISPDSLELLLKDPIALNIYLGIIYQNAGSITYTVDAAGTTKTLQQLMATGAVPFIAYQSYIRGFITQATTVTNAINNVSTKNGATPGFSDYYNLYNSSLDLIQYAQQASQLPGLQGLPAVTKFDNYMKIARAGGNIAFDLNQRNYGSAVMNACTIINYVFPDTTSALTFKSDLLKYGTFMATVAEAQNGTDVENAIEAIVLPAGSASIKRNKNFNIALNAYIGPYFGAEKIQGYDARYTQSAGLTAPMGISASVGNAKFLGFIGKPGWSYSLFVSVIDLGALASYRLTNSAVPVAAGDTAKTSTIPAIQLKDIVSPGAFLSIGIPKTPISISGGFQLGPNLRTVTTGPDNIVVNTYAQKLYTRWSISLVVDLPLLNLYTSSK